MPMTTTHALVPLAGTLAFANKPISWKLVLVAVVASALPDIDGLSHRLLGVPPSSVYYHRGAAHSLFLALAFGFLAAAFHKRLGVGPLIAAVVVAGSMASHGLLDMLTDSGLPVAYLWPLSSIRLFADWRPIHSMPVHWAHLIGQASGRLGYELVHLIIPMFALALAIRTVLALLGARPKWWLKTGRQDC